jgi:hypothetical protein
MRQAMAQECFDAPEMPRRFVIMMQGNGIEEHTLMSDTARAVHDTKEPDSVAEVEGLDGGVMHALRGDSGQLDLTPQALSLLHVSSLIAGGGHSAMHKALSCSKDRRETFDSYLARHLHGAEPFDAIRLGVTGKSDESLQYGMCYSESNGQLPIIANPVDGFSTLFGSVSSGNAGREFATQRELLDFARSDINAALRAFSGSSRERQKLESYLSALESLGQQQERLVNSSECLAQLAIDRGFGPDAGLSSEHPLQRYKTQVQLATTALIGQMTNVVLLTNSVGSAFSGTFYSSLSSLFREDPNYNGIPHRHDVAHGSATNPTFQRVLDRVIEVQVEQMAGMARALAAVPEGDGTMLDHTVILLMSDNGSTHHSQATNWPMLLLGGGALGLRTGGRTLIFPKHEYENNPRVSNLFNTLGHLAGQNLQDWGGEPDKRERGGVLSELLNG